MGILVSKILLCWQMNKHRNLLSYLLLTHRSMSQLADELASNPSWVNGSFDVCGKMTSQVNEVDLIQLEAVKILERCKPVFSALHKHSQHNQRLVNISNHVIISRARNSHS